MNMKDIKIKVSIDGYDLDLALKDNGEIVGTTAPKIDGTGCIEPSSSAGYSRIKLEKLSEPENGVISNRESISFGESSDSWGTITHFVIYDAQTGGNLLMYDALTSPRSVEEATVVTIKNGSLLLTLANPA